MTIEPFKNAEKLELVTQRPDLRRDLHVYVDFVGEREVKRGHRDNAFPRTEARRLAKMLSDPLAEEQISRDVSSQWLDYVDDVALRLGFVNYDTKGVYAGYTSSAPSYPDNFIEVDRKAYAEYAKKTLALQETQLLDTLLQQGAGGASEFFSHPVLGRLDRFSSRGCATGVVPTIDFPQARRFLLKLLAELPCGEWLSTESLIKHLKREHPFFLIPRKFTVANKWDRNAGRYDNFCEGDPYKKQETVKPSDPDAFERVEGRYVERFLEGIPNLLGYVDLGYAKRVPGTPPMLNVIPAFRVSERLRRALSGTITEPTVRVTPNFEVYVQSDLYPSSVITQLEPLAELVSADTTTVYRLRKQKVAAARAADHSLDVVRRLESLSSSPLPDNVRRELADWSEHSEKFVLYTGCSLLETEPEVAVPVKFQVAQISPGTYVVRSAKSLFSELEQQERMPLQFTHGEAAFKSLPDGVCSLLRGKKRKKVEPVAKPQVTLMRVARVQLLCPDREFLQRLQTVLAGAGCPVEADSRNLSLAFSDRYEPDVRKAIQTLGSDYRVKVENQG